MEEKIKLLEPLITIAKQYGETNLELFRLKSVSKAADALSSAIAKGIVILFLVMFLLMINIAAGFYIGEYLGKVFYGFLSISIFNMLIALIIFFGFQKNIKKRLNNSIVIQLLT